MEPSSPTSMSDSPDVALPRAAERLAEQHPEIWRAYQELGAAVSQAGPLSDRSKRLVHLALSIGAESHGATHSHTRRGLAEGLTRAELEHVALLAITTLGWPQAVKGLTWMRDVID